MKICCVCGAGVGILMARALDERELPIILDCSVPGGYVGARAEVKLVDDYANMPANYFPMDFKHEFEIKIRREDSAALIKLLEPRAIAFKEATPYFEPPRFKGYMKRTHRRRM